MNDILSCFMKSKFRDGGIKGFCLVLCTKLVSTMLGGIQNMKQISAAKPIQIPKCCVCVCV